MDGESGSVFWARVCEHHGLASRGEAIAAFGQFGFKRRVARGELVRVYAGIYRVAGAPLTERQRLLGLTWALGGCAGLRSALALRELGGYTLGRPEILRATRSNFKRKLGNQIIRPHRTNFLPDHHLEIIDGITTTTLPRTLCDLSAVVSVDRLERVVDEAKRRHLIGYDDIARCREELRARGRRRTTYLDQVLESRVPGYEPGESPPEDVVRRWLEDGGYSPVAQHPVVVNGEKRRLDLALPEHMIAVEYQGIDAHSTQRAVENDSRKVTELQLAGWFVALVTKRTTKPELLRQIRDAIVRRHA
ncbi:MAG: hypothetical protein QOJ00_436 [Actinomycetota bacterium]